MASRFSDLQEAALYLRNTAPEQWEVFLAQLAKVTESTMAELIMADQSIILTTQGRAKQMTILLEALRRCDDVRKPPPPAPPPR